MLPGFETLSPAEFDALLEAPILITALIGAADGQFDREEHTWSERLAQVFTYSSPKDIHAFYEKVSAGFLSKVDQKLAALPSDTATRNTAIAKQLEQVNPILAKLDPHLGAALYKSFIGLASETAKASGGFLRIGAISDAEYHWVNLPMITPVKAPVNEMEEGEDA